MIKVVPWKYGQMAVNPLDQYVSRSIMELGEYCEHELITMRSYINEHSTVVCVGANIGALALPLAKTARMVIAIEPVPYMYNLLVANLVLNEVENIQPLNIGAGAKEGMMSWPDLDINVKNNFGGAELMDYTGRNQVNIAPLDFDCDVLQIDCEGMERDVITGATEMIKRSQPVIFIENDREQNGNELIEQITALGYKCYWHTLPIYNPKNFNKNPVNSFQRENGVVECSINMLCLPSYIDKQSVCPLPAAVDFADRFNIAPLHMPSN